MIMQRTRKAMSVGNLTGNLGMIAAICVQRMRSRGRGIKEWLLWADEKGAVYFSDSVGTHAQTVLQLRPHEIICLYQGAGVKAMWITEDLQDAAERASKTLAQVAASYLATA